MRVKAQLEAVDTGCCYDCLRVAVPVSDDSLHKERGSDLRLGLENLVVAMHVSERCRGEF